MISFSEFEELAQTYNVIPLVRTMLADVVTPVSTYMTLREKGKASFLLESAEPNEKVGRYSFIGIDPVMVISVRGNVISVQENGAGSERIGNLFEYLCEIMGKYKTPEHSGSHGFPGGFIGYFGFDCVRQFENVPVRTEGGLGEPDAVLGLFTTVVRFDHRSHRLSVIQNVMINPALPLRPQYDEGVKRMSAIELRLRKVALGTSNFSANLSEANERFAEADFCKAVEVAKKHIYEGDIFQVVLSRSMHLPFTGDPFQVYRALRMINPSPYLFYIDFGTTRLIGSSPELLVRVRDDAVDVFPIAGTRKRGKDEVEDAALASELINDAKELAEHIMLVDLGRNDVGRIAEFGSVEVPVLKHVERYSHVMHIVSHVRGRLRRDKTSIDALKACFPAGTVSGAPKVRAMEIIAALEPERRGAYSGAVGYLGFRGELDTCIAIRTIVVHRDMLSMQSGAGIVADSVPGNEYIETVHKGRVLLEAVRIAANGLQMDGGE
ncbi:MAG: anthranilate synthase component I [Bacteroidota bacterium]